jgi:hypothetical protein
MENITIYKFDKNITTKDNIKNFFSFKKEILSIIKRMNRFEDIYEDEIKELKKEIHISKNGDIYFISEMEDSHLVNTVNLLIENGIRLKNKNMKKYLNEVKNRGLIDLINQEKEEEKTFEDFSDEYDLWD